MGLREKVVPSCAGVTGHLPALQRKKMLSREPGEPCRPFINEKGGRERVGKR